MNELNFLEKLLDGIDVEWMSLGNIGSFIRGNGLQKKDFVESGFPAIHYGQIYTRYGLSADKTLTYVSPELANKLRKAQRNDLLLATTSENDEDVVKPLAWLGGEAAISGDMMLFRHEQNVKYLAHFFQSEMFQKQKMKYISGAKVRRVSSGDLAKIKTPIPCPNNPEKSLAIQSEIVRILDTFTALTAELTAELSMRKKQYNYYRNKLLDFRESEYVKEMTLGDIYDFQYGTGNTIPKSGGQYPVYGSNGIVGTHDKYNSEDSPVIGHIGAYAGIVNWGKGKHFVTYNGVICKHKSKEVLPQFAYYLLLLQDFGSKSNSASQPFVSYHILKAPVVLVPPLDEQTRIVTVLDKFETLANSISEGLPREIELRQKQYEYYRDMLFSFPKPEVAEA
ncbi:TPA: restriction endonuclease subunit S [Serratia marcescens]|nr:restriction endonuclease subunit S [Serratia marcescens]HEJ7142851.1 restriction endonuclease subunit S [Serratia marcescens]HEJ7223845.1 restriction endonuclease subunit S [Serratia marcescens]